jgi:hypothetical protein
MKKKHKGTIAVIVFVVVLAVLQSLPIFFVKPLGAKIMSNDFINLYYPASDEKGANEVFNLLVEKAESIYDKMNYERKEPIKVYIYKTQNQLAIREAGLITLTFAPSWHIGDSHYGNVMMVSPNTRVEGHTHDSIMLATLHELVHSINYRINKEISYFWDNGLATYLSGQVPAKSDYSSLPIPSLKDMKTENGLIFSNYGGYAYSYLYIEFLENAYGWDKIVSYASGEGDYRDIFNKSEEEIYDEWCNYLNQNYR